MNLQSLTLIKLGYCVIGYLQCMSLLALLSVVPVLFLAAYVLLCCGTLEATLGLTCMGFVSFCILPQDVGLLK
jgi:hypothetical protein